MIIGKISVVIPAFNAENTVEYCIKSILATQFNLLEIIVVDDSSTDRTSGVVRKISTRLPGVIKLFKLEENRGPAYARNAGAKHADGEYLFFVDSDTVMLPDVLDKFQNRISESKVDAVSGIYNEVPLNSGIVQHYKAMLNSFSYTTEGVFEYEVFNGAVAGIRADAFWSVGGYNEDLSWGMDCENEELGHRLYQKFKLVSDPAIQVRHNFPGFNKLTYTYFMRVALWMELFMRRRRFEQGGLASVGSGIATAAVPLLLLSIPIAIIWPWFSIFSLMMVLTYLSGYGKFFKYILRVRPFFLPTVIVLNIWFSTVITAGAMWGVLRTIVGFSKLSKRTTC